MAEAAVDEQIREKLSRLEAADELPTEDAFALANEIAGAITQAILEAERARQFERVERLAREAERAYLLAADKVPLADRDKLAFASSYWSLQADYARLDAEAAKRRGLYQPLAARGVGEKDLEGKVVTFTVLEEPGEEGKTPKVSRKAFRIDVLGREKRIKSPDKVKAIKADVLEEKEQTQGKPKIFPTDIKGSL